VPVGNVGDTVGVGDAALNYRLQAWLESASRPAFSPRVSLLIPSGNSSKGLGSGSPGWQVNLPFSKQFNDTYLHWNAGFTHIPSAKDGDAEYNLFTPHLAASGIWRARPMFNLMLESVVAWEETPAGTATRRDAVVTISPGFRTGWNAGDGQTIVGLALPASFSAGSNSVGVFGYFSYEIPFTR
jgi:hypothetical protein